MRFSSTLVALLFVVIGCAPKATFELSILNKTDRAITVGLVKEGESYDPELAPPERLALGSGLDAMAPWGHVIPPGRTLDSPPITGAFPRGSAAYLRVYRGEFSNAQLLAISNPSPDRTEVLLFPGLNQVIVRNDPGKGLIVQRVRANRP